MLTVKIVKAPKWLIKGIDLHPYIDTALGRIGDEMVTRHNRSRKLGAQRNPLTAEVKPLLYAIESPLNNPRVTGVAMIRKNTGRFKSMAPRVVKNYIIEPLQKAWAS